MVSISHEERVILIKAGYGYLIEDLYRFLNREYFEGSVS